MRPREPALLDRLKDIVDLVRPKGIPVVANGDCLGFWDVQRIKDLTGEILSFAMLTAAKIGSLGVSSIMIARGAEANASCFREEGYLDPIETVIPLYLKVVRNV